MARTRGSSNVLHDDDGELVDKDGKPINPVAHSTAPPAVVDQPPDPEPVAATTKTVYVVGPATIGRNIDAWELAHILMELVGQKKKADERGMTPAEKLLNQSWLKISAEDFQRLIPNVKQHFMRVEVPEEE